MQLDPEKIYRADGLARRIRELEEEFGAAHKRLVEMSTDPRLRHLRTSVGDLNPLGCFEVTCLGVTLLFRCQAALNPERVAQGRIDVYELIRHPEELSTHVATIRFKPTGDTDCVVMGDSSDTPVLRGWIMDIVLQATELVMLSRA